MNIIKRVTVVCLLFAFYSNAPAQNVDINLLEKINIPRNTNLDGGFTAITNSLAPVTLGTPAVMCITGILKKDQKLLRNGLELGGSAAINGLITFALKQSMHRQRPYETYPQIQNYKTVKGYSFPSGHTSSAFAFATTLTIQYPKWYIIVPAYTYAALMGYSRMHLGVHYPSDVLCGMAVGSGSALLTHWLRKKIEIKKKKVIEPIALY